MKKDNRERFLKIGRRRVQAVIDSLNSLSKVSNKYNYEYKVEEVDKMFKEIRNTVKITEDSFKNNLSKNKKFNFDE